MMTQRNFAVLFLICLFWPSTFIAAQTETVRVRLVYLKSGKPVKGQPVILDLGDPRRIPPAEWRSGAKSPKQITSSDGIAAFTVSKPLPDVLFVEYENGRIEGCARETLIPLDEVTRHGVTLGVDKDFGASCKGDRNIIKRMAARPGEIVIFVRKLSIWEKMRD